MGAGEPGGGAKETMSSISDPPSEGAQGLPGGDECPRIKESVFHGINMFWLSISPIYIIKLFMLGNVNNIGSK